MDDGRWTMDDGWTMDDFGHWLFVTRHFKCVVLNHRVRQQSLAHIIYQPFGCHVLGERRGGRLTVPARFVEPVADVLFVEADLALACLVFVYFPEARGVGGEEFVYDDQLAVQEAEF